MSVSMNKISKEKLFNSFLNVMLYLQRTLHTEVSTSAPPPLSIAFKRFFIMNNKMMKHCTAVVVIT